MTEMTTYYWFEICEQKHFKGHVRKILIKCTIIIILQYTIAQNVPFIVQFN